MLSMRIFVRVLYFFIPKPERIISLESSADSGLSGSFRCGTVVVAGEEINYANNLKHLRRAKVDTSALFRTDSVSIVGNRNNLNFLSCFYVDIC